ncbi:hypothetical protein POM88_022030 [Heracleum sosnowskyi]|uniref:Uncharacterized protein n=1 Tax=Heracleum sosnowskyi TaxID=360622 RepID=A0AAD8II39_9APIA|nr:hypothetical protein POM88_022030 [Heracleum sosnowskyi]
MRGRLRIVSDDNLKTTTWAEVPEEYWREVLEKDVEIPIIHVPPLTNGSEVPEYRVSDDNLKTTTWAEVPEEYWREVLEKDVEIPIIHVPPLTNGSEVPEYGDCSLNFTIKLANGGEFDEKFESYIDGDTKYFDMCSLNNFHLMDLHSMCKELGIGEGSYDLWHCIPGRALDVEFVIPIDEEEDV